MLFFEPSAQEVVKRRPGDATALVANPQKLMTELDWQPRYTDIREIVETAWRWHERHPNGYKTAVTAGGAP